MAGKRLWDNLEPEWLALITEFPDHFMIGGDEFVGIPGLTPDKPSSFADTWSFVSQLPSDIAQKVGRENAARVNHLPE